MHKTERQSLYIIHLDKIEMPTKSEVGILFDTLPDFEVHNHADTRIVRCYFRFYHESRFYAERKPFQSPVFYQKAQDAVP